MMSLTMMGMTPGPLDYLLNFFRSCQWGGFWNFCWSRFQSWSCFVCCVSTNRSRFHRLLTHRNILVLKFLIFTPNPKIIFIAIVLVWPCHTHSDRCLFSKNMILRQPIGSIFRTSNPGIRSTRDTEFIRCVDGWHPQIHRLLCLGFDNITKEVHPTAQVEFIYGIVGEFMTNYLAENGRRIVIIRQPSINGSIQLLGIPDFVLGSGL